VAQTVEPGADIQPDEIACANLARLPQVTESLLFFSERQEQVRE
jgi:hypothetical protein